MVRVSLKSKKNPVWIAASHLTENIKNIKNCCQKGADGIVLKGTDGRLTQGCRRSCQKCQFPASFGGRQLFIKNRVLYSFTPNSPLCEFLALDELKILLSFLKSNYPDVARLANISARNPKNFIDAAKILKKCGAQILELNTKYTLRYKDREAEDNQKYILDFLKKVVHGIDLPIIVKIDPDSGLLTDKFFKKISHENIYGLTITDSLMKVLPMGFKKKLSKDVKKQTCAFMGKPLWKLVKKYLPMAKSHFEFVSASGGIYNRARAKEAVELGADAIQLCSGIEFFGYDLIKKVKGVLVSLGGKKDNV
jgi:dihydroorotate dehydrogenase